MEFLNTANPPANRKLSGLYCGDALTGKTTWSCTWPSPCVAAIDPDTSTLYKHPEVTAVRIQTWQEYESTFVPQVRARTVSKWLSDQYGRPIEVLTIVVDTISVASMLLSQFLQGSNSKLTMADFGRILQKLNTTTMHLLEATAEVPGKESYHVIFNSHLTQVSDDQGNLVAIRPAILGQFKDLLPRLVGFTFLCESALDTQVIPASGGKPASVVKSNRFYVRTVRPDTRYLVGDRIGGGRYKVLPSECSGAYPDLIALWGMPNA